MKTKHEFLNQPLSHECLIRSPVIHLMSTHFNIKKKMENVITPEYPVETFAPTEAIQKENKIEKSCPRLF